MTHIMVWRGDLPEDGLTGFWHHGILCPDDSVIHYSGMEGPKSLHNACILRTVMAQFKGNCDPPRRVHTVIYPPSRRCFDEVEIVRRAESRIGQHDYNLLAHNCETFARWCVVGQGSSFQTQGAIVGAAGGLASIVLGGGLLGAILTAVVAGKMWDHGRNRSAMRTNMSANHDDEDSDDEYMM